MKPVFVHNSEVYPVFSVQFGNDCIRQIAYEDGNELKSIIEKNDYSTGIDMIENLASYVKWPSKYDVILEELIKLTARKNEAFDEASHEVVQGLNEGKAHQVALNNYHVLSGEVVAIDDILALVSLLKDNEMGIKKLAKDGCL